MTRAASWLSALALAVLLPAAAPANAAPKPPARPAPEATPARPADPTPTAECPAALPDGWSGTAYAVDGDTLRGVGLKFTLRLWGIQAPELRDAQRQETVAGMRARAALADLLAKADHKVRCRLVGPDGPCRAVAYCLLDAGADSIDLGGALIAGGMAYSAPLAEPPAFEPKMAQRYADAEVEARRQRRGLWPQWLGERPGDRPRE